MRNGHARNAGSENGRLADASSNKTAFWATGHAPLAVKRVSE